MLLCLPEGKRQTPVGARFSGEPHVFVSADTRKNKFKFKENNEL